MISPTELGICLLVPLIVCCLTQTVVQRTIGRGHAELSVGVATLVGFLALTFFTKYSAVIAADGTDPAGDRHGSRATRFAQLTPSLPSSLTRSRPRASPGRGG